MSMIFCMFGRLIGGAISVQFMKLKPCFEIFRKIFFFSYEMSPYETPRTVGIFDLLASSFKI